MKVHKALPGSCFNSLLLNRYKGGNDYVGWHSDDEKLYGLTPEIASVSFGCDRDFFLKKKPCKTSNGMIKRLFTSCKCFLFVHFLLLEGLDYAVHGCSYILLHQLTVGFIYFKQGYILLFVCIFLTNLMIAVYLHQLYLFLWSTDLDAVNSFFCIILIL